MLYYQSTKALPAKLHVYGYSKQCFLVNTFLTFVTRWMIFCLWFLSNLQKCLISYDMQIIRISTCGVHQNFYMWSFKFVCCTDKKLCLMKHCIIVTLFDNVGFVGVAVAFCAIIVAYNIIWVTF